ncbi:MAG: DNA-binding protein, partial [Candidatus Poseidoniia archaeon]
MVWLGLDDTDSLEGGCTTEMFCKLLKRMKIPYRDARLVRLWPFAEKRTRGNASVGAELLCSFDEA